MPRSTDGSGPVPTASGEPGPRPRPSLDRSGICPPLGKGLNLATRRLLRRVLGVDVHRVRPPGLIRITKSTLAYELDEHFNRVVADAVARTGAPGLAGEGDGPPRVRQRLYNLAQAVSFTAGVPGWVVECGCYRGTSAYVLCRWLQEEDPAFRGASFHVFDSFEGLSPPTSHDAIADPRVPSGKQKRAPGLFRASLADVRAALAEFPSVTFHPGWIPDTFTGAPLGDYRLVHVDLDLHDPTKAAFEFFYPRLAPGGALICDDFGSVRWPGARRAVETFCEERGAPLLRLSSGQALVVRR